MGCILPVLAVLLSATGPAPPSNILLIYVDNVGYGDLGCYGDAAVQTPRIDQLGREGVLCTDFYVVSATCTVSRGALLTGRYPARNGLTHQLIPQENFRGIGLPHRERILPQYLKPAGYATACFGKWNIGFAPGSRPTERGFDEFFGFRSGNINYYTHTYWGQPDMFRQTEPVQVSGYSTNLFADAAMDFIRRNAARPWFVYLPFNAVHFLGKHNMAPGEKPIWQVPAEYLKRYGRSADEPDEKIRYRAVLTALDDAAGRVLDTVDRLGLRGRTLVLLISDNGAFMMPGRGLEVASNGPFRDGGSTSYEGGVRMPCLVRWPGHIPAGTVCHEMLSHLDVLPLAHVAAGLELKTDRVLDGIDPLPALTGRAKSPHKHLVFQCSTTAGMRSGNSKIVRAAPDKPWELYDLTADPGERHNLAAEQPRRVAQLDTEFRLAEKDMVRDASPPAPLPLRSRQYLPCDTEFAATWQRGVRSELLRLLRISELVAQREKIPLAPQRVASQQQSGYELKEVEINSTPERRIKILVTMPVAQAGPRPAVVCIHGHGGRRQSTYDPKSIYRGFAQTLAERGYVTIATDVGQHKVYEADRTLMGERLWDLMRCIDYLQSLPVVDRRRIGCAGLSLGGEMSMWLAAMDQRMAAAVSAGFLTRMDQMEHNHCQCWKFDGLRELVDFADIYALVAPRPLMCQNGLKEPATQFPVSLAADAMREIGETYADFGRPENAILLAHPEGHVINLPSLLAFFEEHLPARED